MNDTIGIFYERPDGRIAYTFGWGGHTKMVSYYLNDGAGTRTVSKAEFQHWTPRRDLRDFPDSTDPRLPYIFGLVWDINRLSGLRRALAEGHEDVDDIRETMQEMGITLDWPGDPYRKQFLR